LHLLLQSQPGIGYDRPIVELATLDKLDKLDCTARSPIRHLTVVVSIHRFVDLTGLTTLGGTMRKSYLFATLCLILTLVFAATAFATPAADTKSVYDFTLKSIDGQPTPLSEYHGKVLLLVNVASKCGYTPQYTALEAIYEKYKSRGLVIVGVPANNFMKQEPGTNEEIKTFCSKKYNVSFPMMSKLSVKGDDQTPLYQFLTSKSADPKFGGEIKWNFTKFLFDRNGNPVARFEPATTPDSPEVTAAIEAALAH
jgi:glutathione peroxidase